MRRLLLIAACTLTLAGCGTTLQSVLGPTSAPVANSVQAAGDLDVGMGKAADAYVKTAACDRTCRDQVAGWSKQLRTYLDEALDAEAKGDNAAAAVALKAFNDNYGHLWGYLTGSGVSVPTS